VDYATGIAVDFVGNAYIAGYTASYDFLSLRAVQAGNAGPYDAFLTKLNAAGTGLVWSITWAAQRATQPTRWLSIRFLTPMLQG